VTSLTTQKDHDSRRGLTTPAYPRAVPRTTILLTRKAIRRTTILLTPRFGPLSRQRTIPRYPLIPLACGVFPSFSPLQALRPTYFSPYDTLASVLLLSSPSCLSTLSVYFGTGYSNVSVTPKKRSWMETSKRPHIVTKLHNLKRPGTDDSGCGSRKALGTRRNTAAFTSAAMSLSGLLLQQMYVAVRGLQSFGC
jgi:hypothetical protein